MKAELYYEVISDEDNDTSAEPATVVQVTDPVAFEAWCRGQRIECTYSGGSNPGTARVVYVCGLVKRTYLRVVDKNKEKLYALSKMSNIKLLDSNAPPPKIDRKPRRCPAVPLVPKDWQVPDADSKESKGRDVDYYKMFMFGPSINVPLGLPMASRPVASQGSPPVFDPVAHAKKCSYSDFLPAKLEKALIDHIIQLLPFKHGIHTGRAQAQPSKQCQKLIFVDVTKGNMPVYHFASYARKDWTRRAGAISGTPLSQLLDRIWQRFGVRCNHIVVNIYIVDKHGNIVDHITLHRDQPSLLSSNDECETVGHTFIYSLGAGCNVEFKPLANGESFEVPMRHNGLFDLDAKLNTAFTHCVNPQPALDHAEYGMRLSVTCRKAERCNVNLLDMSYTQFTRGRWIPGKLPHNAFVPDYDRMTGEFAKVDSNIQMADLVGVAPANEETTVPPTADTSTAEPEVAPPSTDPEEVDLVPVKAHLLHSMVCDVRDYEDVLPSHTNMGELKKKVKEALQCATDFKIFHNNGSGFARPLDSVQLSALKRPQGDEHEGEVHLQLRGVKPPNPLKRHEQRKQNGEHQGKKTQQVLRRLESNQGTEERCGREPQRGTRALRCTAYRDSGGHLQRWSYTCYRPGQC